MIRKLTKLKKQKRKDANYEAVMSIYQRATQRGSEAYLTVNQRKCDPIRVAKIKQQAEERRERQRAKFIQTRSVSKPNGQPTSRGLSSSKGRVGKIRGFARRLLRQTAQR